MRMQVKSMNPDSKAIKSGLWLSVCAMAVLGLSGCQTIEKVNPFHKNEVAEKAAEGKRIPIAAYEQKIKPTDSLAGIDYYLPEPHTVANWLQASGPDGGVIGHADAAKNFKIAWTKSIGQGSGAESMVLAQPVTDGKLIYTLDGEARVTAQQVADGRTNWSRDLNPHIKRDKNAFGGGVAIDEDTLYVTSGFRLVAALDAATGKVKWQKDVVSQIHQPPVVTEKFVIITDVDNQVVALDKATGEQAWTYQALVEPARMLRSGGGTYLNGTLYAPFSSGELIALDAATGNPGWSEVLARTSRTNALSEIRDISGHPIIYKDQVFAASHSGSFAAINAKTGETAWTVTADASGTPWVAGDVVFLTTIQGQLMAVSRESGGVYWVSELNEKPVKASKKNDKTEPDTDNPAVTPKGKFPVWTGPVLASNRLLMISSFGDMVAFDPKTGKRQSTLKLGSAAYIAPIIAGDTVFVVTNDAKLIAIR